MTVHFSTRKISNTMGGVPIRERHQFTYKRMKADDAEATQQVQITLTSQEINLVKALIEENETILWVTGDCQITKWDVAKGIRNEDGVICVL